MGTENRDGGNRYQSNYGMGLEAKEQTFTLSVGQINSRELVGLFRNVPRYRGQDIREYLCGVLSFYGCEPSK
ncbi:hypothetical protein KDI_16060 [Dictyobacter arantiisoli]|uniref:Uncharacterized protein n=1 Tax=Dictyobacter arantiisoli TaxID=2014874 RepID=A0A5A5T9F3_9CHLR|nr:hypothetical protein KDI_16060 [Dictyobacter arantiisoli]